MGVISKIKEGIKRNVLRTNALLGLTTAIGGGYLVLQQGSVPLTVVAGLTSTLAIAGAVWTEKRARLLKKLSEIKEDLKRQKYEKVEAGDYYSISSLTKTKMSDYVSTALGIMGAGLTAATYYAVSKHGVNLPPDLSGTYGLLSTLGTMATVGTGMTYLDKKEEAVRILNKFRKTKSPKL